MKHIIFPLVLLLFVACGTDKSPQNPPVSETPVEEKAPPTPQPTPTSSNMTESDLLGSYVGKFVATGYGDGNAPSITNRINISLTRLEGDKVHGHSVVAGNIRPFTGTFTKTPEGYYEMEVKEPGDDRYDGTFKININLQEPLRMLGVWNANDKSLAVKSRKFDLPQKKYRYDAGLSMPEAVTNAGLYETWDESDQTAEALTEDVIKYNASNTLLKKEEVENMYKADLEFIRNAIYARHGYSFKNRRIRYVFDNYVDWYIPVSTDIRDLLTEVEKQNIDLLKRYEEHAIAYYDEFGR